MHWFEQQIEKKRVKRDFPFFQGGSGSAGPSPYFSTAHSFSPSYQTGFVDPLWKEQWYLVSDYFIPQRVIFIFIRGLFDVVILHV